MPWATAKEKSFATMRLPVLPRRRCHAASASVPGLPQRLAAGEAEETVAAVGRRVEGDQVLVALLEEQDARGVLPAVVDPVASSHARRSRRRSARSCCGSTATARAPIRRGRSSRCRRPSRHRPARAGCRSASGGPCCRGRRRSSSRGRAAPPRSSPPTRRRRWRAARASPRRPRPAGRPEPLREVVREIEVRDGRAVGLLEHHPDLEAGDRAVGDDDVLRRDHDSDPRERVGIGADRWRRGGCRRARPSRRRSRSAPRRCR